MSNKLTLKQEMVYIAIVNFISVNGYSPSVRELCKITNKRSPATIYEHLKNLKAKGYITFNDKQMRTIRVLREVEFDV